MNVMSEKQENLFFFYKPMTKFESLSLMSALEDTLASTVESFCDLNYTYTYYSLSECHLPEK